MYKTIGIILVVITSSFAQAQELSSALLVCADKTSSQQRLACYDKLAKAIKAKQQAHSLPTITAKAKAAADQPVVNAQATSNAPEVKTASKAAEQLTETQPILAPVKEHATAPQPQTEVAKSSIQATVSPEDKFGYEHKQQPKDQIEKLSVAVNKVSKTPFGKMIISLDNGQVWRQTDKVRLKIQAGQTVSIERGMLGSFFMGTDQVTKRIRVKRVK